MPPGTTREMTKFTLSRVWLFLCLMPTLVHTQNSSLSVCYAQGRQGKWQSSHCLVYGFSSASCQPWYILKTLCLFVMHRPYSLHPIAYYCPLKKFFYQTGRSKLVHLTFRHSYFPWQEAFCFKKFTTSHFKWDLEYYFLLSVTVRLSITNCQSRSKILRY
jgi:hypothetical protein